MNNSGKYLIWALLSVIGAFALGYIALNRGEQINALWIVVAAVCVYLIAYRFYGLYIAKTVLGVDPTRMTPAVRHNDGLDYVPTDKKVLFGHHFAAIAGAGPLVGPVLAAQMGYLPGMIWILAGVVLAGAVQDFMVLFVSTRRDGRSLGELVKEEMGPTAGVLALVACFMIMVIILAVLAMIVVKALTHSPWGTYTVAFTIPLAIFMGIYIRYLRPGRIGEVSVIGLVMLVFAIISGGWVAESPTWAPWFDYTGVQLTWILVGYGFVAAVLPVWLLLAPRDYLSTFLKIGTIVGLAIGILIMRPTLTMPALTKFVDGKEFIDRKLMEEQKAGGLTRKLVGFKMIDRGIPRHGYQIASPEGDIIGQVTSGTMSPCLKQGIGMGYVKKEFAKVGTQIAIVIREKLMKAEVVKLPFIQQK